MVRATFNPSNLSPEIDYTNLIEEIGNARSALAELKGLITHIPNPELLTSPLLTKEAVLSSRIEGTHATLEDVLKYEAEEKTSETDDTERDAREIINYRRALHVAIDELKKINGISENLIKSIHYVLLDSVRGMNKNRGNLRDLPVYIGGKPGAPEEADYVPPAAPDVPTYLSRWEKYINNPKAEKDPLVQIGVAHYQFEAIHPFRDGNGRMGRLLIPLFLYHRELLPYPMLYISEFFEENRNLYYTLLNRVDLEGDWDGWLKFFLTGIRVQSMKAQQTVLKILLLYDNLKAEVSKMSSVYAFQLLDLIFAAPIVSFVNLKEKLTTNSPQTIYNLLAKFTKAGILIEVPGRQRNKLYVFSRLLSIVNE